ncbi:MAG: hypothetical protein JWO82_767 [Akkermansiaceae bacterium]|nr:hypothetical protein [Akkermansiaceae bacterium]
MKSPVWLEELHRQWFAARGKVLGARSRPYTREWPKLLEEAGVRTAEDIATAGREGERLEKEGLLVLKRHRSRRYIIERIELPLASETWLRGLFQSDAPADLLQTSLQHLDAMIATDHPLHPAVWVDWLQRLRTAFEEGRNVRPFSWRKPTLLRHLLEVTFRLTATVWPSGRLIREASVSIGLSSKELERSRLQVEGCLASLFGQPVSYNMLGIVTTDLQVEIAGDLCLHFRDGSTQHFDQLGGIYHLSADLERAVSATTTARRVLTVENRKTTLRRLSALNGDRSTLLAACAFPGPGLIRLLELLPRELPVFHFGDTDPAGYLILSKLRQATGRKVAPFLMAHRPANHPVSLSEYDTRILPGLLSDPLLADIRTDLQAIAGSVDKGDYEQESLGVPTSEGWPFYRALATPADQQEAGPS